ncbi:MAG: Acetoin catabolism regulatory protein [Pseudomonadota bacterium]|jgi:transcriptional regulator of acetoin/glycerol metabolism
MHPAPRPSPDRSHSIAQARQLLLYERSALSAPGLSPWLQRSWQRCQALGFEPSARVGFDAVSVAQMRRVQDENQALVQAARPVLGELVRAMGHIGYFAILTDAQGIVVDVHGPVDRSDRRADVIARVGVDLSERAIGTSAISAALTELQPVWLHRGEHFFEDTSVYSCAGAPVFGPDGRCAGMLDLTGVQTQERPALKHLVRRSARSIENGWLLALPHALTLRLHWPGNQPGDDSDGLLTLGRDGEILGANPTARQMLALDGPTDCGHASEVFAMPWQNLFDAALREEGFQELPLWSGLRLQTLARPAHADQRSPVAASKALRDQEADIIRQAVVQARGNVAEAARSLGISRATVYRKLGRPKA